MRGITVHIVAAALALGAAPAKAKDPPPQSPLIIALDKCRALTDAVQRLACFDQAAGTLIAATRTGQVRIVDRGELREARRSLFGFSMPKLPFFAGDESGEGLPDELASTIKSARSLGNGKYRIVIADFNAVWETTESSISLDDPRPGQKITIKRGPMGSYFLRIGNERGVKGRRVG